MVWNYRGPFNNIATVQKLLLLSKQPEGTILGYKYKKTPEILAELLLFQKKKKVEEEWVYIDFKIATPRFISKVSWSSIHAKN